MYDMPIPHLGDFADFEEEPLQEKCGIVALFSTTKDINQQLTYTLLAASGVQHRGQLGGGIAYITPDGIFRYTGNGLIKDLFTPSVLKTFPKPRIVRWTMLHCRYGTDGGYSDENLQPTLAKAGDGTEVTVMHNGQFVATHLMRKRLKKLLNREFPEELSDTYLFTQLLALSEGKSWDEIVVKTLSEVNGAYSLIIGIADTLYLARDTFGIRPLMIGRLNGGWIAASETHALEKVGVKIEREIQRGEIVAINKTGLRVLQKGIGGMGNFCDFEWAYFSRPNAQYPTHERKNDNSYSKDWLSTLVFRERCGKILAKDYPIPDADFVVGVPDSGVAVATGYAAGAGLSYRQVILRDHYDPSGNKRLFLGDDQMELIESKVLGKLSLVQDPEVWKGKIVVIGDDSIVRGNVTRKITKAIFDLGAKEVHWIVGFPPVMYTCHLGVSMRTPKELIAHRHNGDVKKIAQEIGATSVNYISHLGLVMSRRDSGKIVKPKNAQELILVNGGCGGCVTGVYPINNDGTITHPTDSLKPNSPNV